MHYIKNISALSIAILITFGFSSVLRAQQTGAIQRDSIENRSNIKGPLEFKGFVKELSKKLKGATIILYESPDGSHENLTEIYRTVSPGSGLFEFKLEINKQFVLAVEKSGYTTKKIDIDTDVTLARENHTKVPRFEFEVDMVKDLDGLSFAGSVAQVFYQIKTNVFAYQLDYTKEELENEEIDRLEKERKQKEAEQAYKKKEELKEAAQLLLDKENATTQQLIQAAATVGDGNKDKTVKGFLEVFSETDTLRQRKALAMYDQLLVERKKNQADISKVDYGSIFAAAKVVDAEVKDKAEDERQALLSELRKEKEEAAAKEKEAIVIQQKAAEELAREQLAAAVAGAEIRKKQEEKEKRDEVYYAIFNAKGDSEAAIKSLEKNYDKSDPYKEEKAKAIYEAYEKTRLTGTTLSKMDFGNLFAAADVAEQKAIQKELDDDRAKGAAALEAFQKKVAENEKKEQEETARKIEKGLDGAPADRASQLEVFKNSLPKNDPNKDVKAEAMYEQYVKQKEAIREIEKTLKIVPDNPETQKTVFYNSLPEDTPDREGTAQRMYDQYAASKQAQGGTGTISMDFGSMFLVADNAVKEAKVEAKEKNALEKQAALDKIEAKRQQIREEKRQLAAKTEQEVKSVQKAGMAEAKSKKERMLAEAIEKGDGDRDKVVTAISKALPATGDKQLDQTRAEAVYDAYLAESRAIEQSGKIGQKVDYAVLFSAAEKAELESLQKQYEQKEADKAIELAAYEEKRIQTATTIAKAEQVKAEQEAAAAEKAYEETLLKTSAMREERLAEEKRKKEELAKQIAMEDARRASIEKERQEEELAIVEEERQKRLAKEAAAAAAIAKAEEEKRQKELAAANKAAEEQLALLEKQKKAAEDERLKQAREKEEEEKRLALEKLKAEAAAKKAAAAAVAQAEKAEAARLKEEERLQLAAAKKAEADALAAKKAEVTALANAEKQRQAEQLAAEKAEAAKLKEEEKQRLAEAKKAEADALAAKKADEAEKKAAADALAAAEKQRQAELLAAEKAEAAKLKEEERQRLAEAKQAEADALAAKKAEEARLKAEQEQLAALAKQAAEEKEQARKANYDSLISKGDIAMAEKDYRSGYNNYLEATGLYPDDKDASRKLKEAQTEVARIDKEAADKLALDTEYAQLMSDAEQELTQNNYDAAKEKFARASELKPDEREPKQKLRNIERTLDQIAADKKAEAEEERKFVLLMQEGEKAFKSDDLAEAKDLYQQASRMKPDDASPKAKLEEIKARENELAAAALEEENRKAAAKLEFEKQQAEAEKAKQATIAARLAAAAEADAAKEGAAKTNEEKEQVRIEKFGKLQEALKSMDLGAEEARSAFLSELAKIYPEGLTEETVNGKNFVLLRHVINNNNVVTVYEKKTWDWGGVFYFKDTDIAITEAIYKLEIGKY